MPSCLSWGPEISGLLCWLLTTVAQRAIMTVGFSIREPNVMAEIRLAGSDKPNALRGSEKNFFICTSAGLAESPPWWSTAYCYFRLNFTLVGCAINMNFYKFHNSSKDQVGLDSVYQNSCFKKHFTKYILIFLIEWINYFHPLPLLIME